MFTTKVTIRNRIPAVMVALALLAVLLAACRPDAQSNLPETAEPSSVSHGNEIGGYVDLVDALRAEGATVEPAGEVEQPFFEVKGQVITVDGVEVQVFEFADEATRQAASDQISPDGSTIGTTMVTWIDQPNFWAEGRIILLYLGQDAGTIGLLSSVLGEPIAQGSQ